MTQTLSKNVIADFETQLAVKMAVGATTGTLVSATDDDGVVLPTGVYFLTIDRTTSAKEYIKCTITGTELTNIQSISRQGALTTGSAREHRVGANVIISDFASLAKINDLLTGVTDLDAGTPLKYDATATISNDNHLATKKYVDDSTVGISGDETVAGVKTFSSSPIVPTPTSSTQAANKSYVDGVAIAGAPDASATVKGIVRLSSAPISPTVPIALNSEEVSATPGANRVPRADAAGSLLTWNPPLMFSVKPTGFDIPSTGFVDLSADGFTYIGVSGTTFRVQYGTSDIQERNTTSDWASATAVYNVVVIGAFIYVLLLQSGTAYRVYRYAKNNIAAGGTLITFSGQNLAYSSDGMQMTSNGTSFFFSFKAGNSANDYVISRYTFSGTTFTYVSDITCGSTGGVANFFAKVDSSNNVWLIDTADWRVRKYNSSGTLQSTSPSLWSQSNGVYQVGNLTYQTIFIQDGFIAPRYHLALIHLN